MYGDTYKTGIVIPCYNEFDRLDTNSFKQFISDRSHALLLFVDDGSTDNTKTLLQDFDASFEAVHCLYLENNSGKAEAVRTGINFLLKEKVKYVGYFDADLSTPLRYVPIFTSILDDKKVEVNLVMGSRIRRLGSSIVRKPGRHVIGRIFATLASYSLKMPVYDSQCGAKLFRFSIAEKIFDKKFNSRWLFDVEIIARSILHFGYKNTRNKTLEYPLETWQDDGNSRIKLKDGIIIPWTLLQLHQMYHQKIKKIKTSEYSHE